MTERGADDPYTVLGVTHGADDATIAVAYRQLARTFHPDIAGPDVEGHDATARMTRINVAFDTIGRAEARTIHDAAVALEDAEADQMRSTSRSDGTGGAGLPPGRPSGSVLDFGRHVGWSIGEVARMDPGYLAWLSERPEGRPYLGEIETLLRRMHFWRDPVQTAAAGRGRFSRVGR